MDYVVDVARMGLMLIFWTYNVGGKNQHRDMARERPRMVLLLFLPQSTGLSSWRVSRTPPLPREACYMPDQGISQFLLQRKRKSHRSGWLGKFQRRQSIEFYRTGLACLGVRQIGEGREPKQGLQSSDANCSVMNQPEAIQINLKRSKMVL